jgi:hypothetical protein
VGKGLVSKEAVAVEMADGEYHGIKRYEYGDK